MYFYKVPKFVDTSLLAFYYTANCPLFLDEVFMADKIDPKRLSDLNDRLNAKKSVSKKEAKHEDHY